MVIAAENKKKAMRSTVANNRIMKPLNALDNANK